MADNHEVNMNGEPDAVKVARPVRKGIERKGLVTAPRSQSTLHLFRINHRNSQFCDNMDQKTASISS
jgi:hypothetical protein